MATKKVEGGAATSKSKPQYTADATKAMAKIVLRARRAVGHPDYPLDVAAAGAEATSSWLYELTLEWLRALADEVPERLWDDALSLAVKNHKNSHAIVPYEVRLAGLELLQRECEEEARRPKSCVFCSFIRENPNVRVPPCPLHSEQARQKAREVDERWKTYRK